PQAVLISRQYWENRGVLIEKRYTLRGTMFTASYATVFVLSMCAMTIFIATMMLCAQNPSRNDDQQRVEKDVKKPRKFKPKTKEEKKAFKAIAEGNVCDEKGNSTIEDARSDWGEVQKVLAASPKDVHSQV
uniref:Coiled-coil domain-containing protein 12 n=1 Tax=Parascaris univalens TaxID=6257 RepID=A0A915B6T0_PARUN